MVKMNNQKCVNECSCLNPTTCFNCLCIKCSNSPYRCSFECDCHNLEVEGLN